MKTNPSTNDSQKAASDEVEKLCINKIRSLSPDAIDIARRLEGYHRHVQNLGDKAND